MSSIAVPKLRAQAPRGAAPVIPNIVACGDQRGARAVGTGDGPIGSDGSAAGTRSGGAGVSRAALGLAVLCVCATVLLLTRVWQRRD